jgi:peptidyl-prolyl cis-trans isomerase B (cyclophilin B)
VAQDRAEVLMETSEGNIRIQLYNETPKHRDNFLQLVKAHYYDSLTFHRVIKDFMVQGGKRDANSPNAPNTQHLTPSTQTIEAEFRTPQLFHKRGALAAAREGDDVNPERRSSPTQFYFVWGRKYSERAMEFTENRLNLQLTPEQREAYMTIGGTPHLDGTYTVFGEIVDGLDVVERMQAAATDDADRPLQPIYILRATVVRE